MDWWHISGTVVEGHRVASGLGKDPRFPEGTLKMQFPHFAARGLDLSGWHPATLNVSIAPMRYKFLQSLHTFHDVKWCPAEPAEHFSFFDCKIGPEPAELRPGLIYYPHPETKPEHFQPDDVLEILTREPVTGLAYGSAVHLAVLAFQMALIPPATAESPLEAAHSE